MADDEDTGFLEAKRLHAEAQRLRDEASEFRAQADIRLRDANYNLGQARHSQANVAAMERSIAERERKLKELGEPELVAREQAADEKLKRAEELMADYDKEKHAAAINLNQSFERDKREREAAGIEY
jgi:hypothetical protein